MPTFRPTLEQKFKEDFNSYLQVNQLRHLYTLLADVNLERGVGNDALQSWRPDFLVTLTGYPYIAIEVKKNIIKDGSSSIRATAEELDGLLVSTGVDFLVFTDMNRLIIYDCLKKIVSRPLAFEKLYELLKQGLSEDQIHTYPGEILDFLEKEIRKAKFPEGKQQKLTAFVQDIRQRGGIKYDPNARYFYFDGLGDNELSAEEGFFRALLDPVEDALICRYTTLDSLFAALSGSSYRMASHIAMNDRGEVDYVDKYIGYFYKPLHAMTPAEIAAMNNSYISSCTSSEKADDLTMYRLYGDDTKGVCLTFEIRDVVSGGSYFMVKKISYARPSKKHPELDIIKSLLSGLPAKLRVRFRLLHLGAYKHFFKSHEYAVEQEVRVLYMDDTVRAGVNRGWVVSQPDKIISKYVQFGLGDPSFPLQLRKITLGPNFPERLVNKIQLQLLLSVKAMPHVSVEFSSIDSYRKN